MQTFGEAATKISETSRSGSTSVPWTAIVGMRNILVHRYFNLDDEAIRKVVQQDLPGLMADVRQL